MWAVMARTVSRLSAVAVSKSSAPGMYADGGGLYLRITPTGTKSWIFRFMLHRRAREMGLGPFPAISLAAARSSAAECRRLRALGIDPIESRKEKHVTARLEAAKSTTFKSAAESYIATQAAGWRNRKHASQWRATLETYAYPVFGHLPVEAVDTPLVLKVLEPIWSTKTETANRVRGRIEAVLDSAKVRDLRRGENPARWRGHLENLLPKRSKVQRVKHHPALPYAEAGAFIAQLRKREGIAALALEFLILTATRTSETIGAQWMELNLQDAVWTIPAERIKAGKEHRVPLSVPAMAVLKQMQKISAVRQPVSFVFPGAKPQTQLSNMSLLALIRRMRPAGPDLTAHGFRSTFRDWAAERTNYPREVAEMALAHAVSDKVEAAYRRGDLFTKRKRLMDDWAKYLDATQSPASVVAIRG